MDDSGNTSTKEVVVGWIDKEAPVIQTNGYADIYVTADNGKDNAEPAMETVKKKVADLKITDNIDGNIPVSDTGRVTVEYYLSDGVTPVDINTVDFSKEGEYLAIVRARDNVGNETQFPRKIVVLGANDVLPVVNGKLIMPSEMGLFYTGNLTLEVMNLENAGGTVYYTIAPGEYHPAELKGYNKKPITTENNKIKLETSGTGIYTLVLETQERKVVVVYIYVGGIE